MTVVARKRPKLKTDFEFINALREVLGLGPILWTKPRSTK